MTFKERISQAGKKQWLKMVIVNLLCVLFVIWSGYYACLLLLPLFFDAYITRYIGWSAWKKSENKAVRKVMEWVDAIGFALVAVYFINTFFFQNYQIPTSSLEKSLLVGDFLCVSKVSYGARSPMTPFSFPLVQHTFPILNIKSYLDKPQLKYKRLAGFGHVKRGDIVVFNYPSGDTVAVNRQQEDYYVLCQAEGHDNVNSHPENYGKVVYRPVDRRENYVKRCVGLPGETLQLKDDNLFIDGNQVKAPENVEYFYWIQTDGTDIPEKVFSKLGISNEDYQSSWSVNLDSVFSAGAADASLAIHDNFVSSWSLANTPLEAQPAAMGFTRTNGRLGLVYHIPLTKSMIAELKAKPFVRSIIRDKMDIGSVYYPITYKEKNWNRFNYGPIWIPKRGAKLDFTKNTDYAVATYRRCIQNYEGNQFDYRGGKVYINGKQADSYVFQLDYYFMMGDNRDNSADSRVWGFVPEDHIVGQPMFIWLSLNKDKGWFDGKIRWDRLFTSAHKQ